MKVKKLLVIQVAALGENLAVHASERWGAGWFPLEATFPALTCPVQAAFRTGKAVSDHGMVANGLYFRDLEKVLFWEQSAGLVEGERIWERFRAAGGTVGLLFWQQSLGESAEVVVSPAPIHKHSGGMIQSLYSEPASLASTLEVGVGHRFNLMHYWGPLASARSTEWIVEALLYGLEAELLPALTLAYLPHLDYGLQKKGPKGDGIQGEVVRLLGWLDRLEQAAGAAGYDVVVFGDYAIEEVTGGPLFPNRVLREAGLLRVREVSGMEYLDLVGSQAFAVADHQIAQVYVRSAEALKRARSVLGQMDGVAEVLDRSEQATRGVAHRHSGDLWLVAAPGFWFAYPWFEGRSRAPDYATHVDIHNKPGFDPCELFWGWPPGAISLDARKVRGTHGRVGSGMRVMARSSFSFEGQVKDVAGLGQGIGRWLKS
ncbi:MAG: alkaline phosphatase family protein [Candidatus Methylacidiphilales bacterium]